MLKFCLVLTFALLSHEALGFRIKRQSENKGEDLEDRYGWNRPGRFPNQGQLPWQGGYPPQTGWGYPQYPNGAQWPYPESQYPGNVPWPYPNQRPDQFPGPQFPGQPFPGPQFPVFNPGQGQNPVQNPGQGQNPVQNPGQGQNPVQNPGLGQNPVQNPGQNPEQTPNPNQTTPSPNNGSTTQSAALQDCLRTCLVTPEYNPVCGSDNVTYDNPGRLLCAQSCGVGVSQVRASRCPNAVIPPVA